MLLDAAERAGLAPIELQMLHAFAYLADVLSPVWGLKPFQTRLAKTGRAPFFPELQNEIDALVGMGLIEVSELDYRRVPGEDRVQLMGKLGLRFQSPHMTPLLAALEADPYLDAMRQHLVNLANALAILPDGQVGEAASEDVTYSDPLIGTQDYIDLRTTANASRTQMAVAALDQLFPDTSLPPSRKVVMYAHYLGERVRARA
jgi:hypothetical protein